MFQIFVIILGVAFIIVARSGILDNLFHRDDDSSGGSPPEDPPPMPDKDDDRLAVFKDYFEREMQEKD